MRLRSRQRPGAVPVSERARGARRGRDKRSWCPAVSVVASDPAPNSVLFGPQIARGKSTPRPRFAGGPGTPESIVYTDDGLASQFSGDGTQYIIYDGDTPLEYISPTGFGGVAGSSLMVYGPSGLEEESMNGEVCHLLFDPQGNHVQTIDGVTPGAPTTYDAYGNIHWRSYDWFLWPNGYSDVAGFGGQYGYENHPELGLVRLGHRYLDPSTGRFLTRDPVGYQGGIGLYSYASGNPTSNADPSGFDAGPQTPTSAIDAGYVRTVRVGRWMSEVEYNKMLLDNRVQASTGSSPKDMTQGAIDVNNPESGHPDPLAFRNMAKGSVFVEFDVPASNVKPTSTKGWVQIIGPNSERGQTMAAKGVDLGTGMPAAANIEVTYHTQPGTRTVIKGKPNYSTEPDVRKWQLEMEREHPDFWENKTAYEAGLKLLRAVEQVEHEIGPGDIAGGGGR